MKTIATGSEISESSTPLDRGTKSALKRRDALVKKYMKQGMSKADAEQRAVDLMRDNPRMNWRQG